MAKKINLKLVDNLVKDKQLISISVKLQDPTEVDIFNKFLKDENLVCPTCQFDNTGTLTDEDHVLTIDSPLASNPLGLRMASPVITCDGCRQKIYLNMIDYSAFPNVIEFIQQLKDRYNKKKGN